MNALPVFRRHLSASLLFRRTSGAASEGRRQQKSSSNNNNNRDALNRPKTLARRSQDALKRPKTLARRSQDALKRPKTLARRSQMLPRRRHRSETLQRAVTRPARTRFPFLVSQVLGALPEPLLIRFLNSLGIRTRKGGGSASRSLANQVSQ